MTARNDFDRLLTNWLTDEVGAVEATPYLAETLDLVDRTPQRPSRPWSGPGIPRRWTRIELPAAAGTAILVALLVLALIVAALIGAFRPAPSPIPTGPGLIVVATGDGGLAVVDPEGGFDPLPASEGSETMTSVSPDGTRIAYWTWLTETDNQGNDTTTVPLTIANLDGSEPNVILDGVEPPNTTVEERPQWSPDGRFLVFSTRGKIYRVGVDGSGLTTLADDGRFHRSAPTWSPDGTWIAFHASPPSTEPVVRPLGSINVMRPDGMDETVVSGDTQVWSGNFGPAWSADSERLAYVTTGTPQGIEIASLGPSGWTTAPVAGVEGLGDQVMFQWAPVGDRLAYMQEVIAPDVSQYRLMLVEADGTLRPATAEPLSQGFCWSPDGTRLAAITLTGELVAYDVATGARDETFDYPLTNLNVGDACVWSAWAGEPR